MKQNLEAGTLGCLSAPPHRTRAQVLVASAAAIAGLAAGWLLSEGSAGLANARPPTSSGQVIRFQITDPMPGMPRAEGLYQSLAISPDGSMVADGTPPPDDSTPSGRLILRPLDGSARPVSDETGVFAPFFSPDGSRIGFRKFSNRSFCNVGQRRSPDARDWLTYGGVHERRMDRV